MYVVDDNSIPRHRYLRRVSHDTFLQYGERLYADKEEEEELMRDFVDMTFVSGVCRHIVRVGIDYVFTGVGPAMREESVSFHLLYVSSVLSSEYVLLWIT
jgi:hypothetical protein